MFAEQSSLLNPIFVSLNDIFSLGKDTFGGISTKSELMINNPRINDIQETAKNISTNSETIQNKLPSLNQFPIASLAPITPSATTSNLTPVASSMATSSATAVNIDLAISRITTPVLTNGNTLSFNFSLKNRGTDTANLSTTQFYLSKNNTLDTSDVLLGTSVSSSLVGGQTQTKSFSTIIDSSLTTGTYYLFAKADGNNTITETNETNNTRSILCNPDLTVSSLTTPVLTGNNLSFNYTVKNQENANASTSNTQLYLSNDNILDASDTFFLQTGTSALNAGQAETKSFSTTLNSSLTAGTYYIFAKADSGNVVVESHETNNNRSVAFSIASTSQSDLTISNLSTPIFATVGGSFGFSYTLNNQGNGSAGSSTIQFYLSKDTILDSSDLAIGSDPVSSLSAGANSSKSASLSLLSTATSGNYYLLALADSGKAVAESNENNNLAFKAITINTSQMGLYPYDTQLTLTTMSKASQPGYLQSTIDPTFGTTITRVSDQSAFGSTETKLGQIYSKNQVWNADGSYLLLNSNHPAALLDGHTNQFIRWVHQPSQEVWSNVNPSLMYGTYAYTNQFVQLDISNGGEAYKVLHTFSEYDTINFGEGEGNLSNDDRYAALIGIKGTQFDILVYDLLNNVVVSRNTQPSGTTIGNGQATINNVTISQSGNYVVVEYNIAGSGASQGIKLFDRSLNLVRQLSQNAGSHYDLGIDSSGAEVIVVQDDTSSALISVQLSTGAKTTILSASLMDYSIHISCRNTNRPGWAYISEFTGSTTNKANYNKTFAVKLDGSGTVEIFANENHSSSTDYSHMAMGVPNPDGTKVMFASDWNNSSNPVYAYIAQMK